MDYSYDFAKIKANYPEKIGLEQMRVICHISKKTAQRDVEILSCSYPIYTRTTCAGGIFAMEGWYASKSYLHDDQEALLRKLLAGLQPEDQKTMQSILDAFAKPTKEANR